jgi:hypothetical protein
MAKEDEQKHGLQRVAASSEAWGWLAALAILTS